MNKPEQLSEQDLVAIKKYIDGVTYHDIDNLMFEAAAWGILYARAEFEQDRKDAYNAGLMCQRILDAERIAELEAEVARQRNKVIDEALELIGCEPWINEWTGMKNADTFVNLLRSMRNSTVQSSVQSPETKEEADEAHLDEIINGPNRPARLKSPSLVNDELLQALKGMVDWWTPDAKNPDKTPPLEQAKAAIAKAEQPSSASKEEL